MADNFIANAGAGGETFASDDIGGIQYPISKIGIGALNSVDLMTGGAGAVSAGTPRVTLASDDPAVTKLNTIDVDTGNIATSVSSIDSKITAVNTGAVVVSSSALPSGASTSANQSTEITALQAIQTAVQGTLTVTGGGGGTEYTEDAAAAANPVGTTLMLIREDARAGSLTTTDGDNVALRGNNKGEAYTIDTDGNALLTTINSKITAVNTGAVVLAAGTAGIGKLTANSGVDIGDVDITSIIPGTTATSLGKAEDDPHVSADTGVMSLAVRKNTAASTSGTDGDYQPLITNTTGHLWVDASGQTLTVGSHNVTNAGTFVVQENGGALTSLQLIDDVIITDNAAFTDGTTKVSMNGFIYDEVAGTALSENDSGAARINSNRSQIGVIEDGVTRARYATVTAANSLKVDGSGVTQPVSLASGATAIAKAEDVASADADVGVPSMAVRKATPVNTSGTDGDYEFLQMSAGRLWSSATIDAAIPTGANLMGDVGISGARTSGGTTIFRSLDIDQTEEDVKTSAGQVYWIHAMNLVSTKRYLKFYNATAANVTVGTTTPVLTFALATQGDTNGAGFTIAIPNGIAFSTAICVACTTGLADNDTGAPGDNDVIINIGYA